MNQNSNIHEISFSELFYKIYESSDAEKTARVIANKYLPDVAAILTDVRIRIAKENMRLSDFLNKADEQPRPEQSRTEEESLNCFKRKLDTDLFLRWTSNNGDCGIWEYFICEPEYENDLDDTERPSEQDLLIWLSDHKDEAQEFLDDEKRVRKAIASYCKKKPTATILLLPYLKSDHDMILFFGEKFHTSFANVDAYTGLHYAHEFMKKKF